MICTLKTSSWHSQKLQIPGHFVSLGNGKCPVNMSPHKGCRTKAEVLKWPKTHLNTHQFMNVLGSQCRVMRASALSLCGNKMSRRLTQVSQLWTNYHLIRIWVNRTLRTIQHSHKQKHSMLLPITADISH